MIGETIIPNVIPSFIHKKLGILKIDGHIDEIINKNNEIEKKIYALELSEVKKNKPNKKNINTKNNPNFLFDGNVVWLKFFIWIFILFFNIYYHKVYINGAIIEPWDTINNPP